MPALIESLRSSIRAMAGYTPGEQPRDGAFIKLNTNENPYPPSPHVFEALRAALTGDRLRKYPDPLGTRFRQAAGRVLGVDPDGVLIGNGSDDVRRLADKEGLSAHRASVDVRLAPATNHPGPRRLRESGRPSLS